MDRYNSKIARVIGWLNKAPYGYAVTISGTCTLYSVPKEQIGSRWRKHEDCHQDQIKKLGWFTFMGMYLVESIGNGYKNNCFEIEARQAENT